VRPSLRGLRVLRLIRILFFKESARECPSKGSILVAHSLIVLASQVRQEAEVASIVEMKKAKIPVVTFPIKKRINTEQFIDRIKGIYIQEVNKETDQENILIRKTGSRK